MCGIIAILSKEFKSCYDKSYKTKISSMVHELRKRGPDNQSHYSNQNIYFGHTRLKVLDPSDQANQPFIKDDSVLIFNGEIYNYKELREKYLKNIVFITNSDTEVLFHLLLKFGETAVEMLEGQFSFIFYNLSNHKMIVARDHVGICPLYVYENQCDIVFCSHIFPIVKEYQVEFDEQGFVDYLSYRYTPQSSHTLFKQVRKFPPGMYWIVDGKTIEIKKYKYWGLKYQTNTPLYSQEKFNLILDSEIKKQLQGDLPIGVFLSGGVDSQSVLKGTFDSNINIMPITLYSNEEDDDKRGAEKFLSKLNLKGNFIQVSEQNFQNLEDAIFSLEEPFGDLLTLGNYELAREGSKYAKIFMSGEGGDELFLSYHHQIGYLKIQNLNKFKFIFKLILLTLEILPPWIIGKLAGYPGKYTKNEKDKIIKVMRLADKKGESYKEMVSIFNDDEINRLLNNTRSKKFHSSKNMINNAFEENLEDWQILQKLDIEEFTLPINLLKQDKFAARYSLESRVPLVSKTMLSNISKYINFNNNKIGNKNLLKNYIGEKIKKKIPFSYFHKSDSRQSTKKLYKEYVLTLDEHGFSNFKQDELIMIYNEISSGSLITLKKATTLIIFGVWWRVFAPHLKDMYGNKLQMAK
jgi:asparagine synthase (glutamine-hydrolysing)